MARFSVTAIFEVDADDQNDAEFAVATLCNTATSSGGEVTFVGLHELEWACPYGCGFECDRESDMNDHLNTCDKST